LIMMFALRYAKQTIAIWSAVTDLVSVAIFCRHCESQDKSAECGNAMTKMNY
jgi:hypothetical protein